MISEEISNAISKFEKPENPSQITLDIPVAELLPHHLYDMTLDQFLNSSRAIKIRYSDIKSGEFIQNSAYIGVHHALTYNILSKEHLISKTAVLANCLVLGYSVWQHENFEVLKDVTNTYSRLYFEDYGRCLMAYRSKTRVRENEKTEKKHINVYSDVKTSGGIAEMSHFLNVSVSELCSLLLAIGFLRWERLPEGARVGLERELMDHRQHIEKFSTSLMSR